MSSFIPSDWPSCSSVSSLVYFSSLHHISRLPPFTIHSANIQYSESRILTFTLPLPCCLWTRYPVSSFFVQQSNSFHPAVNQYSWLPLLTQSRPGIRFTVYAPPVAFLLACMDLGPVLRVVCGIPCGWVCIACYRSRKIYHDCFFVRLT